MVNLSPDVRKVAGNFRRQSKIDSNLSEVSVTAATSILLCQILSIASVACAEAFLPVPKDET